jgi:hypothetical protein
MESDQTIIILLSELEMRLHQKEVRRSPVELDSLLAENFIEFGGNGQVYDKQAIIQALVSEGEREFTISDLRVEYLPPHVALVTYLSESSLEGKAVRSLRSSLWRKSDRGWQMVFHQGTKIA